MWQPALQAHDLRLGDRAVERWEEVDEVFAVTVGDLVVREAREAPRVIGRRRDGDRATWLPPRRAPERVARVEDDPERALRRREGVDVVPRRRSRLARDEAAEDVRAVGDRRERVPRLLRETVDDLVRDVGGRGDDRRAGAKLSRLGRHHDAAVDRRDASDARVGQRALAERGRDPLGERRGAADDVRREALPAIPDEMEVPDPVPRGEHLGLAGGARERAAEERVHIGWEPAHEVGERPVVHELEQPPLPLGGRLARSLARHRGVAPHREAKPNARPDESHTIAETQRQPEREELDRAARDELAVERHGREAAGNGPGLDADLVDQAPRGAARAGEHVRAEVEPVLAAALRADAAPEPLARLEQDDVAVAQLPGGRKAGDAAADDDHVAVPGHGRSMVTTTSSPSTRTA